MSTMDSPEKVCSQVQKNIQMPKIVTATVPNVICDVTDSSLEVTATVPNVICDVTDSPPAVVPHEDIDFNRGNG